MKSNCETCSRFPKCDGCKDESKFVDMDGGKYVIYYVLASLFLFVGLLIYIV